MRLTQAERHLLKNQLHTLSDEAKLYLFGSRVDDDARGGDIDLLVLSDTLTRRDIRRLRIAFFEKFGEQKLDIVLDHTQPTRTFTKLILPQAVVL